MKLTAVLASTLSILALLATLPASARQPYSEEARIKSAEQLLRENELYRQHAAALHARAEETIRVAQTLKGKATDLEIQIDETKLQPHLSGARLKAAQGQFATDLNQFKMHANDYQSHLKQFQGTLGECHANEAEFQQQVQHYQIHADEFHLPDIRPPHICGALHLSVADSRHVANQMMMDQQRVVQSQVDLNKAEGRLANAVGQEASLVGKALKENKRELAEQNLAQEFARLREEYETLAIEHAALTGKSARATLSSTSVKGKITGK